MWIAVVWLAGCASTSSWDRTLTTVRSRGWTVDVISRLTNRYVPGTLFTSGVDQWPVEVDLRARRSGDPIELGTLWFSLSLGEATARRLHEGLAADSCADASGRIALRVRGVPAPREHERDEVRYVDFDRPWWIVEAFDGAIAPTRLRVAAGDCRGALAQAPPPADWVHQALLEPLPSTGEARVRLRTITVDSARYPPDRRLWAERVAGALVVSAHAGLHATDALDFTLRADAIVSESDLASVEAGSDPMGPFDVFAPERERLRALVARGGLEAHWMKRVVPEAAEPTFGDGRRALEDWAESLTRASSGTQAQRAAAESLVTACADPASRGKCFSWRMAALGAILDRLGDAALCARAKAMGAALGEPAAALERTMRGCEAR